MRVAAVVLTIVLAGCGALSLYTPAPQPTAAGPCTVELVTTDGVRLDPPYMIRMRPAGEVTGVIYEANGWTGPIVELSVVSPRGRLEAVGSDAASLNETRTGQDFDTPGIWVLELKDDQCYQRLVVEVRPPGG